MAPRAWRPFAAPAAFLVLVTLIVVIAHGALHHGHTTTTPATTQHAPVSAGPKAYIVRPGDTLASIAGKTGVEKAKIMTLNPKLQPTSLFIGERIRLR